MSSVCVDEVYDDEDDPTRSGRCDGSFLDRSEIDDETQATAADDGEPLADIESQTFTLKPLVEMGVVGACRRGRRRGRKNRTEKERRSEKEQRRRSKNARERERVENVRNEYAKLQKLLGLGRSDEAGEKQGRCGKLRLLNTAIEYIKTLTEVLRSSGGEAGFESSQAAALHEHQTAPYSATACVSPVAKDDGGQVVPGSLSYHQNYDQSFPLASQTLFPLTPSITQPNIFNQDLTSHCSTVHPPYHFFPSHSFPNAHPSTFQPQFNPYSVPPSPSIDPRSRLFPHYPPYTLNTHCQLQI